MTLMAPPGRAIKLLCHIVAELAFGLYPLLLRRRAGGQPTRNDTGIMTAAAFSGQIQPSAWTSPISANAHAISMT
jgi:hypothetical protein